MICLSALAAAHNKAARLADCLGAPSPHLQALWLRSSKVFRRRGLFDRLEILRQDPVGWRDEIAAAEAVEARGGRSPLQVVQAVDCADWLPHDLLTKVDRCLMAHGVEGRTPLLDPAVAAAAFRLPDALKIRRSRGKWLLRRRLVEHLPEARPFARKRGFTVPVPHWIAREGKRLAPLGDVFEMLDATP